MGRIYHYTTLESLALILKTRTLRFTRLDCVDDIREAQSHVGIDFGKYVFVSCWTQESAESIPQWNMYSREMQGVRVEFPEYPFPKVVLRPPAGWDGVTIEGELTGPMPFEMLFGPNYFIAPIFVKMRDFSGVVQYVPDVGAVYASSVVRQNHPDGKVSVKISDLPALSRKKSSEWAFQREYRFSLFIFPSAPLPRGGQVSASIIGNIGEYISQSVINNIGPGIDFFDVPLDPSVFKNMAVRTGPLCSLGTHACVEALVKYYAPTARIEQSSLAGSIRSRRR